MYNRQIISYTNREVLPRLVEQKDTFGVRNDRPHVWLQRVCCWVLGKLGATHTYMTEDYLYYQVDVTDLVDSFKQQYGDVVHITGNTPSKVVMGVEDFHRLTNALQMNHVLSFNLKAPINRYHRADLTGIPVMVLPWMSGILVLP